MRPVRRLCVPSQEKGVVVEAKAATSFSWDGAHSLSVRKEPSRTSSKPTPIPGRRRCHARPTATFVFSWDPSPPRPPRSSVCARRRRRPLRSGSPCARGRSPSPPRPRPCARGRSPPPYWMGFGFLDEDRKFCQPQLPVPELGWVGVARSTVKLRNKRANKQKPIHFNIPTNAHRDDTGFLDDSRNDLRDTSPS